MGRRFTQVDVFGDGGVTGNPLAVVHDAAGLDDAAMQAFAAWTNLSETTFLLPPTAPGADYRVRIFTVDGELPFAGHPTLGSAHAWLTAGGVPRRADEVVQECGVGLVRVRRDADRLAFAAPPRRRTGPLDEGHLAVAEAALGSSRSEWVAHEWGDNGPPWMMVEFEDAAAVRAAWVDRTQLGRHDHLGLVGRSDDGYAYEVRGFLAHDEDPVTGSLNAAVAQWLRGRGEVPARYVATQGSQVGRHGEVFVDDDGVDLWIGGRTRTVISGDVEL
ncbi:MAG: PhzF family phenazine biosynthesis protein [Propionicimonas sp.]|uniref:PhzF family phenazine biosynthesis protein n=1 Tax=Propionicimonas sp. TaxID=1955623 RepID=UPI003D102F56